MRLSTSFLYDICVPVMSVCCVQCMMVMRARWLVVVSKEDMTKEDVTLHQAQELGKQTG